MYFLSFENNELEKKIALIGCICAHALCMRMRCVHGLSGKYVIGYYVVASLVFKCVAGRLWSFLAILLLYGKLLNAFYLCSLPSLIRDIA